MEQVKPDATTKLGKETKEQQESKKKVSKNEGAWDWQPIATELAISVAKGIITGFTLRLGGQIYDHSFNRRANNPALSILDGGKTSVAI